MVYVGGKEYYGNVYFKNGVKFAGTSIKSGTNIRVFESREGKYKWCECSSGENSQK